MTCKRYVSLENQELHKIICPACGKQVEAVACDGRVKGYCAVAKKYVDFLVKSKLEKKSYRQDPEYRAKQKAAIKNKGTGLSPS